MQLDVQDGRIGQDVVHLRQGAVADQKMRASAGTAFPKTEADLSVVPVQRSRRTVRGICQTAVRRPFRPVEQELPVFPVTEAFAAGRTGQGVQGAAILEKAEQEFPPRETEQFFAVPADERLSAQHPLGIQVSGEDVVPVGIGHERDAAAGGEGQDRPVATEQQQFESGAAVGGVALPVVVLRETDGGEIENGVGGFLRPVGGVLPSAPSRTASGAVRTCPGSGQSVIQEDAARKLDRCGEQKNESYFHHRVFSANERKKQEPHDKKLRFFVGYSSEIYVF